MQGFGNTNNGWAVVLENITDFLPDAWVFQSSAQLPIL